MTSKEAQSLDWYTQPALWMISTLKEPRVLLMFAWQALVVSRPELRSRDQSSCRRKTPMLVMICQFQTASKTRLTWSGMASFSCKTAAALGKKRHVVLRQWAPMLSSLSKMKTNGSTRACSTRARASTMVREPPSRSPHFSLNKKWDRS